MKEAGSFDQFPDSVAVGWHNVVANLPRMLGRHQLGN
jgi:hypothetical protein